MTAYITLGLRLECRLQCNREIRTLPRELGFQLHCNTILAETFNDTDTTALVFDYQSSAEDTCLWKRRGDAVSVEINGHFFDISLSADGNRFAADVSLYGNNRELVRVYE